MLSRSLKTPAAGIPGKQASDSPISSSSNSGKTTVKQILKSVAYLASTQGIAEFIVSTMETRETCLKP